MINPQFGDRVICSGWLVKNSLEYFDKPDDLLKKLDETADCVYVQETYSLIDAPCGGIVIGKVTINTELHLFYEEDDQHRAPYVYGRRDKPVKVAKVAYGINKVFLVPIDLIEEIVK